MKKTFEQPNLLVFHIGKEIATDVISASIHSGTTDTYFAPDRFDAREDYDAGY